MAGKEKQKKQWNVGLIAGTVAMITLAHFYTPHENILLHNIFQRLYYLPIIYAAISFGLRGGLASAFFAGICYVPHILITWHIYVGYAINQYAEIVLFFLVGSLTGLLSDQQRRQQSELVALTARLHQANRELKDSFEQIKRADRLSAIGQLSAGLAHEIRNPLASIEGAAGILKKGSIREEERVEFLAIIEKECRRLNRLLTSLLDFARPRDPQREEVDVGRLFDSTIRLVEHLSAKQGISFRKILPEGGLQVQGDEEQLKQVMLNLALNAIQAMREGGEIQLASFRQGNQVLIQVVDQGTGIEGEDPDRIFNPFYTTKEQGTGLGLAVAFQIMERHGGALRADRNQDQGMTFSIRLPGPSQESR